MNYRQKIVLILAAALFTAVGCKSEYDVIFGSADIDVKYNGAFKFFNEKKYLKAATLFESLSVLTAGTERDDTVRFYWGLSNYRYKDYYTAETNFSNFLDSYPRSPFAEEARFLRLDCLYRATLRYELDQAPTRQAISAIMQYLAEYPGENPRKEACDKMLQNLNERLDRKAYENARLYYKMEDYKASRVAFKNILKDDAENVYREDILYYIAMSSFKYANLSVQSKQRDRYMTFIDDYLNFAGEYPESQYRREMNSLYRRAQRALGRNVAEDEDDNVKDKDFARERKKMLKEQKKKNETSE